MGPDQGVPLVSQLEMAQELQAAVECQMEPVLLYRKMEGAKSL